MGNACCGGEDVDVKAQKTIRGSAPPPKVMTPNEDDRREQARAAAEERARKNAVRGTQRYTPKPRPKEVVPNDNRHSGPDISDWT